VFGLVDIGYGGGRGKKTVLKGLEVLSIVISNAVRLSRRMGWEAYVAWGR
jgi:hypothetical protein